MSSGSAVGLPAREPGSLRVLLVEDNPDDALLLQRHLRRGGFQAAIRRVETAEAMRHALDEPWDCILADYNLPLFSAPEALRLLQSTGHDVPFIMMSGAVSEATAVEAMRAGAQDYVSKENLTRLVPAIERELAEAASRRLKRATEHALRSSEERFRNLVEGSPLALVLSDMAGRVTYANSGAHRLLGYRQSEISDGAVSLARIFSGSEFGSAQDEDAARHIAQGLLRKLTGATGQTWETTCRRSDQTALPALLAATVLPAESAAESPQLAVFFVDLRDQKRGEEVLRRTEKLAAAGRLAASIAHEINNPLEAITNCLFLLDQAGLEEPQRTYLGMARQELDRVTQIATQTLRFYRQSSRPVPTSIPELLDSVLALYEARMRNKGIEVTREYAGAPSIVALDGEIRQVLVNIVGNAVDALQGALAPRALTLRAHSAMLGAVNAGADRRPGVAILIADRGTGMPPEVRARLFEPFFSTKGITGTGLGLWVSAGILAKHNGRLQVRSRAGQGTVFRILLPLESVIDGNGREPSYPTLL